MIEIGYAFKCHSDHYLVQPQKSNCFLALLSRVSAWTSLQAEIIAKSARRRKTNITAFSGFSALNVADVRKQLFIYPV